MYGELISSSLEFLVIVFVWSSLHAAGMSRIYALRLKIKHFYMEISKKKNSLIKSEIERKISFIK